MELQQFVTESLNQILKGVSDAQGANNYNGIEINPNLAHYIDRSRQDWVGKDHKLPNDVLITAQGQVVVMVHFDVAVTATEGSGRKGGIGVFVGAIGLGSQGQSDKSNVSATKIQFKVPVALPHR